MEPESAAPPAVVSPLRDEARSLDDSDSLRAFASEFRKPTLAEINSHTLPRKDHAAAADGDAGAAAAPCTYLCGNSLGLQPKRTAVRVGQYLDTWATQGVQGHFKPLDDSPLPTWLDADDKAAGLMAPIVGAHASEVAVMQTLTANLHLLMSAFYRPDPKGRHKIILESKAFPSDHFAVLSQVEHHGLSPDTSVVTIDSPFSRQGNNVLTTYDIQSVISQHAAETAVLLLPGVQYFTGQLFDIAAITAYARQRGIFVIWDLAHAVGNVPLSLHDWGVDAAAWCTYKYLNGGPGCIGGMFVHSRNSRVAVKSASDNAAEPASGNAVDEDGDAAAAVSPRRLSGWWGNDKATRFAMETPSRVRPVAGAAGFQLSNPSILDLTSLGASLEVFEAAGGVARLRDKSRSLTGFLGRCLAAMSDAARARFKCLTPDDPEQRGAQLSLMLLGDGLLEPVLGGLRDRGVVVDERKPNVIRVAPAPLYNSFADCVAFAEAFEAALLAAAPSAG